VRTDAHLNGAEIARVFAVRMACCFTPSRSSLFLWRTAAVPPESTVMGGYYTIPLLSTLEKRTRRCWRQSPHSNFQHIAPNPALLHVLEQPG
jgi:hypothetical protein